MTHWKSWDLTLLPEFQEINYLFAEWLLYPMKSWVQVQSDYKYLNIAIKNIQTTTQKYTYIDIDMSFSPQVS